MRLGVPAGDRVYWMEIDKAHHIIEGHIGYRRFDKILLRKDIFDEFIYACSIDDGPVMRKILQSVIDLESLELTHIPSESKETAQGLILV